MSERGLDELQAGLAHVFGSPRDVDMDLRRANLPPTSLLQVGGVLLEVTPKPHRGCAKFSTRFGSEALGSVLSERGRAARLRGLNARVASGGTVREGDVVAKIPGAGRRG